MFFRIFIGFVMSNTHILCLVLLCRRKALRKRRFIRLVLCLSASDLLFGSGSLYFGILDLFRTHESYLIQCRFLIHLLAGTTMFSLTQRMQICVEQLNATFVIQKRLFSIVTSHKFTLIALVLTHLPEIIVFLIYTFNDLSLIQCNHGYSSSEETFFRRGIVVLILITVITVCYCIIVIKIKHQHKKQRLLVMSGVQRAMSNDKDKKLRKQMGTLLAIVTVTSLAYLPRVLYNLYLSTLGQFSSGDNLSTLQALNLIVLLNPLVDPFIYFSRLETVRNELKPQCCRGGRVGDAQAGDQNQLEMQPHHLEVYRAT